jgi:hypothetical protein
VPSELPVGDIPLITPTASSTVRVPPVKRFFAIEAAGIESGRLPSGAAE